MEKKMLVILIIWLIMISSVNRRCQAIWITLPPAGPKCISEEIQNNVVVLADYNLVTAASHEEHGHPTPPAAATNNAATISIKVTSPRGNTLHHRENVTEGQFAFTTHESGNYLACFWFDDDAGGGHKKSIGAGGGGERSSVNVDWKTGIGARDWEGVARKEKIEGVELELRKLQGGIEEIHKNLISLKDREAEMRIVSEKTNARVARWSMMSLAICITVSVFQLLYLKQYFVKKKLI